MNKKRNGFTLVELISVLVIMAVLALIATPLILTLVNKAKASANKRSVDAYGKAIELSVLSYLMDNGEYPSDLSILKVEYSGKEVACNVMTLNNDGSIHLSECSVDNIEVKDASTEDGWYHYGKQVVSTTSYQAYSVGDTVTYNGIEFYVISPSYETSDSVTLLKAEPLTVDEVNTYGTGYVNNYALGVESEAYDYNGYGGMAYYSSSTCGFVSDSFIYTECKTDYNSSAIKHVIDNWSNTELTQTDLKEDGLGYKTRLLTKEDLISNLGYDISVEEDSFFGRVAPSTKGITPNWVYNDKYWYWTMSQFKDKTDGLWVVLSNGYLMLEGVAVHILNYGEYGVVRPVITLYKSAL